MGRYTDKLIIGTANFGIGYNGHKVSNTELPKIWEYCLDKGIKYADCASAYQYTPPKWVKTINKITSETDEISQYATLIHHTEDVPKFWPLLWQYKFLSGANGLPMKIGVSIYSFDELTCLPYDIVQLPYSAFKTRIEAVELKSRAIEIHVRSVFRDGLFEESIKDPYVDRVIIGIDNLKQLRENFELCEKWENEK